VACSSSHVVKRATREQSEVHQNHAAAKKEHVLDYSVFGLDGALKLEGGVVGKAEDAAARARMQAAAQAILVSTGDVQAKYQPLNIVFAVGGSAGGLFTTASPQLAFEAARYQLQLAALSLGGNSVVHCRFGYQSYTTSNFGCSGTQFTVSGYGTVVKFV
jgi:uncharacterized protein YbjQ (UPF0145 family)